MNKDEALLIARRIAGAHALDKHVLEQKEFPEIAERVEFENMIFRILANPDAERPLARGRHAYWSDKEAAVVVDANSESNGTAFKPKNGKNCLLFVLNGPMRAIPQNDRGAGGVGALGIRHQNGLRSGRKQSSSKRTRSIGRQSEIRGPSANRLTPGLGNSPGASTRKINHRPGCYSIPEAKY